MTTTPTKPSPSEFYRHCIRNGHTEMRALTEVLLTYLDEQHAAGQGEPMHTCQLAVTTSGAACERCKMLGIDGYSIVDPPTATPETGERASSPEPEQAPGSRENPGYCLRHSRPEPCVYCIGEELTGAAPIAEPPSPVAGEPPAGERNVCVICGLSGDFASCPNCNGDRGLMRYVPIARLFTANSRAEALEKQLARERAAHEVTTRAAWLNGQAVGVEDTLRVIMLDRGAKFASHFRPIDSDLTKYPEDIPASPSEPAPVAKSPASDSQKEESNAHGEIRNRAGLGRGGSSDGDFQRPEPHTHEYNTGARGVDGSEELHQRATERQGPGGGVEPVVLARPRFVPGPSQEPAPVAERPIVVGSTWRHKRSGHARTVIEFGGAVVWLSNGNDWHVDEFRAGNEWVADPPLAPTGKP